MVRTQLYLPDDMYKALKAQAKAQNMTFAGYVRVFLAKDVATKGEKKSLCEKYPFLNFAGMIKGSPVDSNNEEIDKFLYGF
ncbi:MAG: hypothetical protein WC873_00970 [Candidatus Gracilibacteria bacterium]